MSRSEADRGRGDDIPQEGAPTKKGGKPAVDAEEREGERPRTLDYIAVLGRPLSAIIAGLTVGLLGFYGNKALEREQNTRLYTELLSRREEAESGIRTNMFSEALAQFLGSPDSTSVRENDLERIEHKLLRLEMLALNFGESLTLSPLFLELDRAIERLGPSSGSAWEFTKDRYRERLHSLARRVSGTQLAALSAGAESFELKIAVDSARAPRSELGYVWPDDAILEYLRATAEDAVLRSMASDEQERLFHSLVHSPGMDTLKLAAGIIDVLGSGEDARRYRLKFYGANSDLKTVNVALEIKPLSGRVSGESRFEFGLSFYDFPLIDNTRLPNNQRFALVLEEFKKGSITVRGVSFPGQFASHRDKPFLDEAIGELNELASRQ